jgi:hypothetical protein
MGGTDNLPVLGDYLMLPGYTDQSQQIIVTATMP